ncbi:chaplin family protein, partial [Microbacterium thalli]
MNTIVSRAVWGTLLAGGITILGASVAHAADTTGEDGLLSGTQGIVSVDAPVTVEGTSIAVIGDADSSTSGSSAPATAPAPSASTSGADGVGSGSQAIIDVSVPVTIEGTSVSVIGDSNSSTDSTPAPAPAQPAPAPAPAAPATDGSDGVASGTQVVAPVAAPVEVNGTAVSVIGDANSDTTTGGTPGSTGTTGGTTAPTTDGNDGLLSGTQVIA